MGIKRKAILIVLAVLLAGVTTFTAVKVFRSNDAATPEAARVEKVAEAKPTPTPVKQAAQKAPESKIPLTPGPLKEGRGVLYALLIMLAVALAASVFLIIHLLHWRQRLPNSQLSVVPEELMTALSEQVKALNQYMHYVGEYIQRISKDREKTDGDIVELQKSFAIFQESLNKKDNEIERYKNGYDSAIYKKFLNKFTKFYVDLKREADAPENQQSAAVLKDMLELLEDALLECSVELKTPALMGSADEHKDIISGNRKTENTDQPELDGKIAEVLAPAFVLKTQTGEEMLRGASIKVFVYKESEAA